MSGINEPLNLTLEFTKTTNADSGVAAVHFYESSQDSMLGNVRTTTESTNSANTSRCTASSVENMSPCTMGMHYKQLQTNTRTCDEMGPSTSGLNLRYTTVNDETQLSIMDNQFIIKPLVNQRTQYVQTSIDEEVMNIIMERKATRTGLDYFHKHFDIMNKRILSLQTKLEELTKKKTVVEPNTVQPILSTVQSKEQPQKATESDPTSLVSIGTSGKTMISKHLYDQLKFSSFSIVTRKLLMALFPRRTLATHSLTGKASPAFKNKPIKMKLPEDTVNDIICFVAKTCNAPENRIRNVITTKCADEKKMYQNRADKKKKPMQQSTN